MKLILLILFTIPIFSQSLEIKQEYNKVLWVVNNVDNNAKELTRVLQNLDNKLIERDDFECAIGINNGWVIEDLYRGHWLIKIYIDNKLVAQKDFYVK